MGIFRPRNTSISASVVMVFYIVIIAQDLGATLATHISLLLTIGLLVFSSAFVFAIRELKETIGVTNELELGISRLLAVFGFAILVAVGYISFVLNLAEIFTDGSTAQVTSLSMFFLQVIIVFLILFPFFQFYYLAKPGEGSSIPAEFPIESVMEGIADKIRSPFFAAIIVYAVTYILPILFIQRAVNTSLFLAVMLWVMVLPLISIGALAGSGFGEDLLRIKLLRNPGEIFKLGLPKINIKQLKFKSGGLVLVLIAIQAIVTTAYFALIGIGRGIGALDFEEGITFLPLLFVALINLFNKGRGGFKELKEVWQESGFKVTAFQLFVPVYVFLGVILSSIVEVFVQNGLRSETSVLTILGLTNHFQLTSFILIFQNLILIFTAYYIWRYTPGPAERRMIKEVPKVYGDDISGYIWVYHKLEHSRSVERLLKLLQEQVKKQPSQINLLTEVIREALHSDEKDVQRAGAGALLAIVNELDEYDQELMDLTKLSLESEYDGTRIYGIKIYTILLQYLKDQEREEGLQFMSDFLNDPSSVVSWNTSIGLQRQLISEPDYRSFILALVIQQLNKTNRKSTIESILRFFKRLGDESYEIGQMAISTLSVRVSGDDDTDKMIRCIREILRSDPTLSSELVNQVASGIKQPDLKTRKDNFKLLMNIAEYGTAHEEEVLDLILEGVRDPSIEVQEIAYEALANEVQSSPKFAERIFTIIISLYSELEKTIPIIGAIEVCDELVELDIDFNKEILDMVEQSVNHNDPKVRAKTLEVMAEIAREDGELAERIYERAIEFETDENEEVRAQATYTLGNSVVGNPSLAQLVYREIKEAKGDQSFRVQLAAIESLGKIAASSSKFVDEIVSSLKPLLDDENWQVRLAAFKGLIAAIEDRQDLSDELEVATLIAIEDNDRTVREEAVDAVRFLIQEHKQSASSLLEHFEKQIPKVSPVIRANIIAGLQYIVADNLLLVDEGLLAIKDQFDVLNNDVRHNALQLVKTGLDKLQDSRGTSKEAGKALDKVMTGAMQAANHSHPKIRSTAYEVITEITAALPESKVAKRGRKAIKQAKEIEKDVGLQDLLETAKLRTKPPLDLFEEDD